MKTKFLLLLKYIHRFSFFQGIRNFFLLSILKSENIRMSGYSKIVLRKNTSDFDVFNQVFVDLEYNLSEKIIPRIIIDGGANIGLTSLFFQKKYPQALILSIEPDFENFQQLKINCLAHSSIIPINKALWKDDKGVNFIKSESKDSHHISYKSLPAEKVHTITMADILNEYNIREIDILKLDIEGAEREIFNYNVDLWLPHVKVLIIELHDRFLSGCSMSVFKALSRYSFDVSIKGELLVFKFKE